MEITGKIVQIKPVQNFDSGFYKQLIVVEAEEGKYPQTLPIEFLKKKVDLIKDLREGMRVKVFININSNEFNNRWYVQLTGWKVDVLGDTTPQTPSSPEQEALDPDDDIPF